MPAGGLDLPGTCPDDASKFNVLDAVDRTGKLVAVGEVHQAQQAAPDRRLHNRASNDAPEPEYSKIDIELFGLIDFGLSDRLVKGPHALLVGLDRLRKPQVRLQLNLGTV